MSRCFPYPPPGYYGSKASNEALIESIKLLRENEKAKAERKKEKKDKKDKRREKKEKKDRKEKDKAKQNLSGGQDGKAHSSGCHDGIARSTWVDSKGLFKEKRRDDIDQQMERSGLTEEHEQPVRVHKPSYSSDSTENSNKRKRPASPSPSGITGHGNVIRIRLPLRRHKELNLGKESICSTSGRSELSAPAPLRKDAPLQGYRIEDKKLTSNSGTSEVFNQVDVPIPIPIPSVFTPFEKELQAVNLLYKELVGSWVPPAPQSELSSLDDEEWLFSRKHQDDRQGEKRYKPTSDLSCRASSKLQPCAQMLQEADIFALPYTLPF